MNDLQVAWEKARRERDLRNAAIVTEVDVKDMSTSKKKELKLEINNEIVEVEAQMRRVAERANAVPLLEVDTKSWSTSVTVHGNDWQWYRRRLL
jgi:hypothetical protein